MVMDQLEESPAQSAPSTPAQADEAEPAVRRSARARGRRARQESPAAVASPAPADDTPATQVEEEETATNDETEGVKDVSETEPEPIRRSRRRRGAAPEEELTKEASASAMEEETAVEPIIEEAPAPVVETVVSRCSRRRRGEASPEEAEGAPAGAVEAPKEPSPRRTRHQKAAATPQEDVTVPQEASAETPVEKAATITKRPRRRRGRKGKKKKTTSKVKKAVAVTAVTEETPAPAVEEETPIPAEEKEEKEGPAKQAEPVLVRRSRRRRSPASVEETVAPEATAAETEIVDELSTHEQLELDEFSYAASAAYDEDDSMSVDDTQANIRMVVQQELEDMEADDKQADDTQANILQVVAQELAKAQASPAPPTPRESLSTDDTQANILQVVAQELAKMHAPTPRE
eukprot:CAMPEP_0114613106 /NCGR_PEP_ID=MMETSP0168-20121206/4961_1 /TAXON_ID=95228 ORGANISM="Vannella sp., Strain DIVA3 517/6/12" /NCGR_SAMPLE_ID=MMETSP0168 /ASSEMBLY_ACC=CAM_ASM_000044 /LENGTH=404 /DNA_ID=CAMNT_0001824101 /DNA_START=1 /DNA_END=1212 /DNA_ORIENTATION=+